MPRAMPDLEAMEARLGKLERDTRLLKRACAFLLALLAAGILILQSMLQSHVDAPGNPHDPHGKHKPEAPDTG